MKEKLNALLVVSFNLDQPKQSVSYQPRAQPQNK